MIGYIKIFKPELKVKELQLYNSYYCGICKSLGDRYGIIYRNLLNYDSVFIAVALDSIKEYKSGFETFRCALHPTRKKTRCAGSSSIDYAADVTVYLTYKKLMDNIIDDNSTLSKLGSKAMKQKYLLSKKRISTLSETIDKSLDNLLKLEKQNSDSIDATADTYGKLISDVISYGLSDNELKKPAEWFGYNIGKWIYIIDAFNDIEDDLKKKNYNPILRRFLKNQEEGTEDYKKRINNRLSFILYSALSEAAKAYDLIDKTVNSGIIRNILYEGLYSVTEKVLNGDNINAAEESI